MTGDAQLSVQGSRLVNRKGESVVLRGFGLGGWMNMENFITGYPGSESQQRDALRRTLGEAVYQRFFDTFLHDFFDAADAEYVASLGMNCLRVPFSYRHFEDDGRPFELKRDGFAWLDDLVSVGAAAREPARALVQSWLSDSPARQ